VEATKFDASIMMTVETVTRVDKQLFRAMTPALQGKPFDKAKLEQQFTDGLFRLQTAHAGIGSGLKGPTGPTTEAYRVAILHFFEAYEVRYRSLWQELLLLVEDKSLSAKDRWAKSGQLLDRMAREDMPEEDEARKAQANFAKVFDLEARWPSAAD
jgi:hypothetical protein